MSFSEIKSKKESGRKMEIVQVALTKKRIWNAKLLVAVRTDRKIRTGKDTQNEVPGQFYEEVVLRNCEY